MMAVGKSIITANIIIIQIRQSFKGIFVYLYASIPFPYDDSLNTATNNNTNTTDIYYNFFPSYFFCIVCSKDSFKQQTLNSPCTQCPARRTSNENRTSCTCSNGYYKNPKDLNSALPCYGKFLNIDFLHH